MLISDSYSQRIRVLAAATGTFYGRAMTAGDIYTIAGNGTQGFSGDGGPATAAELNTPLRATVDAAGNVVISDSFNQRIRVLAVGDRHVLRAGDDRRGHLHHRREWHGGVLR